MIDVLTKILRLGGLGLLVSIATAHAQTCGLRDNGATMTDPVTGIEIQKCPVGLTWNGEVCAGVNRRFEWSAAVQQYGQGTWRLITKDEGEQVLKRSKNCNVGDDVGYTWTSSPHPSNSGSAWFVGFGNGEVDSLGRGNDFNVRLVRANQSMGGKVGLVSDTQRTSPGQNNSNAVNRQDSSTGNASQSSPQAVAQQSQQVAQQNQTRADQQRQGKRKTHDPAAEAHECIAIDKAGSGNYGAFKNICNYPVNFSTCNEKPKTIQGGFNWSADFDCAKNQFGLHTPKANSSVAAHNRNTEYVYWFACKAPAMPTDVEYTPSKGLVGRCW